MNFKTSSEDLPIQKTDTPSISLKKCSRCKKLYDGINFKFNLKNLSYSKQCITCQKKQLEYVMKHYNKNKDNEEYQDKVKGYRDKYRQSETFQQYRENRKQDEEVKERKRIADREWRANNAEKVKEQAKRNYTTYYAKHKDTEEYKERRKKNRSKPEIKEKSKEYYSKSETKERRNKIQNRRRKEDIGFALRQNVSQRINKALKNVNSVKSDKTVKYLGCSMVEFVKHIEKQFKDGMTWDNYGRSSVGNNKHWEVDHIIPINYEKPSFEDVKERLVYTNCQPMWAEENRSKSNRYIG